MKKLLLLSFFLILWSIASVQVVLAAGIVGNGNPASCTDVAFSTALAGGGEVTFNCGDKPVIIANGLSTIITQPTTITASNNITLSGGSGVLTVAQPGVTLTVKNLGFENAATAIVNNGGTVFIENSRFHKHQVTGSGGALLNMAGQMTISDSVFSKNSATVEGGAIVNQGTMTIVRTTLQQNIAGGGGAIRNIAGATLVIDDSDLLDNVATLQSGGAISNHGVMSITKSTLHSNYTNGQEFGSGGAMYMGENSRLSVVNSTWSANLAGYASQGGGHALHLKPGASAAITNTTVAHHIYDAQGSEHNGAFWVENGANVTLANTLIYDGYCEGAILDHGNNVSSFENDCNTRVDRELQINIDDRNGGRHITYLPRPGTSAIDRGNTAICPATDQRGITRPQGAACDIGAVEYSAPTITSLTPASALVRGGSFVLTVNGQNLLAGMIVTWKGLDLATTFVNTNQLQAIVPAELISLTGTIPVQVRVLNQQKSNSVNFQVIERLSGELSVTLSLQKGVCGSETQITVLPATQVNVCYVLRNTGSQVLTRQSINDLYAGTILSETAIAIQPGGTYTLHRVISPTFPTQLEPTWTALAANGNTLNVNSSAFINVINPNLEVQTTVSTTPNTCGSDEVVTITYGEKVTFCVKMLNKGDAPLHVHSLTDTLFGEQFKDRAITVPAGQMTQVLYEVTPQKSRLNRAVWTAINSALPNVPQIASDTAGVKIIDQGSRDVGELRVWADKFVDQPDGTTIASSRVRVGPKSAGENSKYYSVNTQLVWKNEGPLTGTGIVGTNDGDLELQEGGFTIDTTTGQLLWTTTPINKFVLSAGAAMSGTEMTINVTQPTLFGLSNISTTLPEIGNLKLDLEFSISVDGVILGGTKPVTLTLAGGKLTGQISADSEGLRIGLAELEIPTPGKLKLPDLIIDGKGDAKIRFASESATIADIDLGNGVLTLFALKARIIKADDTHLGIALSGKMLIDKLDEIEGTEVEFSEIRLVDKKFGGSAISNPMLKLSGTPIKLRGVSLKASKLGDNQPGFLYTLESTGFSLRAPEKWDLPDFLDQQIEIDRALIVATQAPTFRVPIGDILTDKSFNILGKKEKSFQVSLSDVNLAIKFGELGLKWHIEVKGTLNIRLGKDNSANPAVKIIVQNGNFTAKLTSAKLKVAGFEVSVSNLDYSDQFFKAKSAKLKTPITWGVPDIEMNGIVIDDENGFRFGDGTAESKIPDFDLFDVIYLSDSKASVQTDGHTTYTVTIASTFKIAGIEALGDSAVSATGQLWLHDGKVDGKLEAFSFKVVGIEFKADKPTFVNDRIKSDSVTLTLPPQFGGVSTTIKGLEIGDRGLAVRGGSFKLPDFTIGGVGLKKISATFERDAQNNNTIGASGRLAFEAFEVEAKFKLAYISATGKTQVRQVYLEYEGKIKAGTAIPVADTGFFITTIYGGFDLNEESFTVTLGVKGAHFYELKEGTPLLTAQGEIKLTSTPFEIKTTAATKALGMNIASAEIRITSHSFELKGDYDNFLFHGALEVLFGKDADDEFTMYGKMYTSIGINKGQLGSVGWSPFKAELPPFDITFIGTGLDAGKFIHKKQKVWGARGYRTILAWDFYIFAKVAPDFGIDVGEGLDDYKPVRPALVSAAGCENGQWSMVNDQLLTENTDPSNNNLFAVQANDNGQPSTESQGEVCTAQEDVTQPYQVNITNPTDTLIVLEAVTQTHWIAPQNIQVISPNGVPFQLTLDYSSPDDKVTRLYTIKIADVQKSVGVWQIMPQAGNLIDVFGIDPKPVANSFDVVQNGNAYAINWSASNNQPEFTVDVYAEAQNGMRYPIAGQNSTALSISGNTTWVPALPSGVYSITLSVEDGRSMPATVVKGPFTIQDTTAPATPQALQAQPRFDGSVQLTWTAGADKDLAGYEVVVDGVVKLRKLGKFASYEVFGLAGGSAHQISVAAYDLSGNLSAPAIVGVTMPNVGVNALLPSRNGVAGNEFKVVFDQPVTPANFTLVDSNGTTIAGSMQGIDEELGFGQVGTVGMRFVPTVPLAPGTYLAAAYVTVAGGESVQVIWPFTVAAPVEPEPAQVQVFLPIVAR